MVVLVNQYHEGARTSNIEHRISNSESSCGGQALNSEHRTPNVEYRTPNVEHRISNGGQASRSDKLTSLDNKKLRTLNSSAI